MSGPFWRAALKKFADELNEEMEERRRNPPPRPITAAKRRQGNLPPFQPLRHWAGECKVPHSWGGATPHRFTIDEIQSKRFVLIVDGDKRGDPSDSIASLKERAKGIFHFHPAYYAAPVITWSSEGLPRLVAWCH